MEKDQTVMMRLRIFLLLAALSLTPGLEAAAQDSGPRQGDVHSFFVDLALRIPSENHDQLVRLTDRELLNTEMNVEEMSAYIGATLSQTKMVYLYSRLSGKDESPSLMTPLEFVHSLADDLFQRKSLQGFVNKRQKEGLILRRDIMDAADKGRKIPEDILEEMALSFENYTF